MVSHRWHYIFFLAFVEAEFALRWTECWVHVRDDADQPILVTYIVSIMRFFHRSARFQINKNCGWRQVLIAWAHGALLGLCLLCRLFGKVSRSPSPCCRDYDPTVKQIVFAKFIERHNQSLKHSYDTCLRHLELSKRLHAWFMPTYRRDGSAVDHRRSTPRIH